MAIVTLAEVKAQLNIVEDDDDTLLSSKIAAAQEHIERLLGFTIETQFPDSVPASLKEAVLQLAAWWYEQRESALTGTIVNVIPHGVEELVREHRLWSFGDAE